MLTSLLFAGVCTTQPYFPPDELGPPCTPSAQLEECRCAECMCWDPQALGQTSSPTSYEINRQDPDGSYGNVGTVYEQLAVDGDTGETTRSLAHCWCFAHDVFMPREGQRYTYMVRACNAAGCSAWSTSVDYVAAPYAVDSFRPPVVGNP